MRDISTTNKEYAKQLISDKIVEVIEDLQERYDCKIYLDRDDIDLLGDDNFYEQIFKNISKHRWET